MVQLCVGFVSKVVANPCVAGDCKCKEVNIALVAIYCLHFFKIDFSWLWKVSTVVLLNLSQVATLLAFTCRRIGGSNLCCVKLINFSSLALSIGKGPAAY